MTEKVVGLRGNFVPTPGEPLPEVVELLERLLVDAKAGRLHCIGAAWDTPDGVHWHLVGSGMGCDLIGGVEMVKSRILRLMIAE